MTKLWNGAMLLLEEQELFYQIRIVSQHYMYSQQKLIRDQHRRQKVEQFFLIWTSHLLQRKSAARQHLWNSANSGCRMYVINHNLFFVLSDVGSVCRWTNVLRADHFVIEWTFQRQIGFCVNHIGRLPDPTRPDRQWAYRRRYVGIIIYTYSTVHPA